MRLTYLDGYHFFNASIMSPSPVIVKVGVDGTQDIWAARALYPSADIRAYEADPKNYTKCAEAVAKLNAVFINKAVGDDGEIVLHRFVNTVGNSVFPRHTYDRNCRLVDKVTVPSVGIDEVVRDVGGRVDLLVLNCEGGELPIMDAMRDTSVRESVGQICVSFHDPRIYKTELKNKIVRDLGEYYHIIKGQCSTGGIPDQLWIRKVK